MPLCISSRNVEEQAGMWLHALPQLGEYAVEILVTELTVKCAVRFAFQSKGAGRIWLWKWQ